MVAFTDRFILFLFIYFINVYTIESKNLYTKGVLVCQFSKKEIAELHDYYNNVSCIKSHPVDIEIHSFFYIVEDSLNINIDSLLTKGESNTALQIKGDFVNTNSSVQSFYERNRFDKFLYKVFYIEGFAKKTYIESDDYQTKRKLNTDCNIIYDFDSIEIFKQIEFDDYWTNIFLENR